LPLAGALRELMANHCDSLNFEEIHTVAMRVVIMYFHHGNHVPFNGPPKLLPNKKKKNTFIGRCVCDILALIDDNFVNNNDA